MQKELRKATDQVERLRQELGDLMAVVNRDGGHRAATFKTTREAVEDCISTVCSERGRYEACVYAYDNCTNVNWLRVAEKAKMEIMKTAGIMPSNTTLAEALRVDAIRAGKRKYEDRDDQSSEAVAVAKTTKGDTAGNDRGA